jgi:hypothetical protein
MPGLIVLREELLSGDLRSLYLGWLSGVDGDVDDDDPEPPVPAGLRTLTAAQDDLVALLRIDDDLLAAAAERSADLAEPESSRAQLAEWLWSRSSAEKDAWLLALLGQSTQPTRSEILLQYRQSLRAASGEPPVETLPPRTCRQLRQAREAQAKEAERRRAEEDAAKRVKEAKQAAKVRNLLLNQLAKRIDAAWDEVEQKISTKQTSQYPQAVKELTDLHDLAIRDGHIEQYDARLSELVRRHQKKYAFVQRLRKAGLIT